MPATKVLLIEERNIPGNNDLWINAIPILNTSKLHGIKCMTNNRLSLFLNAAKPIAQEWNIQSDNNDIEKGNWILVNYYGQK